jgi:hypothetical protein
LRYMINGLHEFLPYKKVAIHLHSCKWIGEHVQYVQYVAMQQCLVDYIWTWNAIKNTFKLTNKAWGSNPNPFKCHPLQEMILHTNGLGSVFFCIHIGGKKKHCKKWYCNTFTILATNYWTFIKIWNLNFGTLFFNSENFGR